VRAFVFDKYKQPVHEAEVPEPGVGDHDVLVRVTAAGVNQLDEKIRDGEFKAILPYKTPLVLGHDVAGTVIRTGAGVSGFRPGDQVFARPRDGRIGTFAERIAIDEADLAHVPAGLSPAEAASLPLVALTAWQALVVRGNLQPGQKVLVHAGAGGVGSVTIQLAKHLGAEVATTASAKNADFVRDLGADVVVDYRTQDFAQVLHDYDVVLDSLGEENTLRSLQVLRPGGIAISISGPPDPAFARQLGKPLLQPVMALLSLRVRAAARKRGVRYSFLFMQANGSQLGRITDLVEAGALKPVVDRTFAFDDAVAALDYVGTGRARGKVVLEMP
jgi:NADPH:quinone reductase-like Zn-dependent oxidoreductase